MSVRLEEVRHTLGIRSVVARAFPTHAEADLVDALRADGDAIISVVAEDDDGIVGHAMLSRMRAPFAALGLAPVAVLPERQGRGIGQALVRRALHLASEGDWDAVFVLGDPAYYRRFGFRVEDARGFQSPYAGPHFLALPLHGALPTRVGQVAHAPAFAALG